ncbi:MAG TPA: TonB-dependent receptor [Verrucomicrobiae bacterium]
MNVRPIAARGLAGATFLLAGFSAAADSDSSLTNSSAGSLADLTVEQLMNEPVTSVAKRQTRFNEAAAAISVITQEDIRRFGVTSIPEALRLAPGLDVAQINDHEWAISARGFNNQFANKLLVLVDGRSIYGTGFGGVLWSVQDLVLEDIDRIEVIRGPGAALWGANAMNGVINIITKSAKDTQGTLISVSGGTLEQPATTVRYGGQLATNLFYRVYGKFFNRDGLVDNHGHDAPDRAREFQAGTRLDWEPSAEDRLTLQGDLFRDRFVENQDIVGLMPPYLVNYNQVSWDSGGNVLGRWNHDISATSSLTVQAYYDRFNLEQAGASEIANTLDFDAQHRFALGNRNEITWGLGYRYMESQFRPSDFVSWNPPKTRDRLLSSFLQDEIAVLPNRLKLTLGSKFEHNDYTGWELEPSGRLSWTPTERQTVWAAVSRAVRTPSWSEMHDSANLAVIPPLSASSVPILISGIGGGNLECEKLMAYEAGYRAQITKHVSLDLTGFYNRYDSLIAPVGTATYLSAGPPPHLSIASVERNAGAARAYGVEASARWDVTERWHLTANYSWFDVQFDFNSPYLQAGPGHQAMLRSALDLPYHLELNGAIAYVAASTTPYGIGQLNIPDYVRLDVGIVWHATKNLELGVWGQNLTADRHAEFASYKTTLVTEIPRSVVARATLRF